MRFEFYETPLFGLCIIKRKPIADNRGFLTRFFCAQEFEKIGLTKPIVQINHTYTKTKGTVRGMHFQYAPHTETKIVSCIRGEIMDVVVDIRKNSPTFLKWFSILLSEENQTSLYIPDGFAHGFQSLTDNCELFYLHTEMYKASSEGALNVNDPKIGIKWMLPITEQSERARNNSMLNESYIGV